MSDTDPPLHPRETATPVRLRLKRLGWAVAVVAVAVWLAFLHYTLPQVAVVQITGTDVVRMDKRVGDANAPGATRDVRFINALTRDGEARVYRNEDTGWGWPPYFKFDSGTLASKADGLLRTNPEAWVRLSYYGWRIEMLSMFPNVLDLNVATRDASAIPWAAMILFVLIHAGLVWGYVRLRRLFRRRHVARV